MDALLWPRKGWPFQLFFPSRITQIGNRIVWSRDVARWFRSGLSVSGPFVCRCLISLAVFRFHIPLIEPDMRY